MANPEFEKSVWEMQVLIRAHADYVRERLKWDVELNDDLIASLLRVRDIKNEIIRFFENDDDSIGGNQQ